MNEVSIRRAVPAALAASGDAPSLFALSMWIRGLFVGASMAVAGTVSWVESGARNTSMLALAGAGLALGVASVICAHGILHKASRRDPA